MRQTVALQCLQSQHQHAMARLEASGMATAFWISCWLVWYLHLLYLGSSTLMCHHHRILWKNYWMAKKKNSNKKEEVCHISKRKNEKFPITEPAEFVIMATSNGIFLRALQPLVVIYTRFIFIVCSFIHVEVCYIYNGNEWWDCVLCFLNAF